MRLASAIALVTLMTIAPKLTGQDREIVTVTGASGQDNILFVGAEIRGTPLKLTCSWLDGRCSSAKPGEYLMIEARDRGSIYDGCNNVVLYKNSLVIEPLEQIGVYCTSWHYFGSEDYRALLSNLILDLPVASETRDTSSSHSPR